LYCLHCLLFCLESELLLVNCVDCYADACAHDGSLLCLLGCLLAVQPQDCFLECVPMCQLYSLTACCSLLSYLSASQPASRT
jgi:hypothetical protein